jgi:hypothetical protein
MHRTEDPEDPKIVKSEVLGIGIQKFRPVDCLEINHEKE